MALQSEEPRAVDRRSALRKGAVAAAASGVAFAAPRIKGLSVAPDYAAAQTGPGDISGPTFFDFDLTASLSDADLTVFRIPVGPDADSHVVAAVGVAGDVFFNLLPDGAFVPLPITFAGVTTFIPDTISGVPDAVIPPSVVPGRTLPISCTMTDFTMVSTDPPITDAADNGVIGVTDLAPGGDGHAAGIFHPLDLWPGGGGSGANFVATGRITCI